MHIFQKFSDYFNVLEKNQPLKKHKNMYIGMRIFFFCLRLQYGLVWHFQPFLTLWHMRKWYHCCSTLRKREKASLGQNPPSHGGLRRATPGLVLTTSNTGDWLGSAGLETFQISTGSGKQRRALICNRESAWGSQWQPPWTTCQIQLGLISNQDPQRSGWHEALH